MTTAIHNTLLSITKSLPTIACRSVVALLLAFLSTAQAADDPFTFIFDENGSGSISINGGPFKPLLGKSMADPTNLNIPALTFMLPEKVANGEVVVFERPRLASDALRFTDAKGNLNGTTADRMIYYSGPEEPDEPVVKADFLFPRNIFDVDFESINEIGFEGILDGFIYRADTCCKPGWSGPDANVYIGISDGPVPMPEPSTLFLVGTGLLLMNVWRRKARTLT